MQLVVVEGVSGCGYLFAACFVACSVKTMTVKSVTCNRTRVKAQVQPAPTELYNVKRVMCYSSKRISAYPAAF
jgi:hypothetical protein